MLTGGICLIMGPNSESVSIFMTVYVLLSRLESAIEPVSLEL